MASVPPPPTESQPVDSERPTSSGESKRPSPRESKRAEKPPRVEPSYGSDENGLVWAYWCEAEKAPRLIEGPAVLEALADTTSPGFAWLHFNLSNANAARWLDEHLELPEAFYEALEETTGSTRLERDDESLVAVVHDVLFDFGFDAADIATVNVVTQPRLLVSARTRPLRSIDRLRAEVKGGEPFRSSAELFARLLRDQAEVLADILRQVGTRIDAIEDAILTKGGQKHRAELGSLRRLLVRLRRLLAPEPAALFRLLGRPPSWLGSEDVVDLRQAAEEFSIVVSESTGISERIKLLQEEIAARSSEENNTSLFVLTLVTTAALPFNVVGALFGMNVGGIPLAESPRGFWSIVALVAVFTAVVGYLVARRRQNSA